VAAVSSVLALDLLRQLDDELATVLAHVDTVIGGAHRDPIEPALGRLALIQSALRDRVIAGIATHTGEWTRSLVQIRTVVLLAELAMLRAAALDLPHEPRMLGEGFSSVDALSAYVIRGIERITASLACEQFVARRAGTSAERVAWEHVALGKALASFAAIGRDDRLLRALRYGARMPSLPFMSACRGLLLLLGSLVDPVDGIPDLPALPRRYPPGGEPS